MSVKKNSFKDQAGSLALISLLLFLVRLIHARLLLNHAYLGADGPNYINGFLSIIEEGFLSPDYRLLYWPAGYSIFMYGAYKLIPHDPLFAVSLIQNIFCGLGIYLFTRACNKIFENKKFVMGICILLNTSPMIYGMSLSIGYESILISLYLVVLAMYIFREKTDKASKKFIYILVIFLSMITIVSFQPRFILTNFIIIFFFHIWRRKFNSVLIVSVIFLLLANVASPLALTLRNHTTHGVYMVSSNLADTLLIGAGDHASGAYNENPKVIPCELDTSSLSNREKTLRNCVLHWYLTHPSKAARLFLNKAFFYWTPWSGPLSKGTLGSNPWLKIAPGDLIQKNIESSSVLLFTKFISFIYLFGYIALSIIGYRQLLLRKKKDVIIRLAHISFISIVINMLISMATIGDNRFRVPMIGFLMLLQLSAWEYLIGKYHERGKIKAI